MEIVTNLSSNSEIALERKAKPNERLKLTKKLTSPITPIPKIPQKSI